MDLPLFGVRTLEKSEWHPRLSTFANHPFLNSVSMNKTLVIILGPPAVGKMTVGLELALATGFKFMHNHQAIEAILPTFPFGTPQFLRLLLAFRRNIFEEVAASEAPGFIYTTAWDLSSAADREEIDSYCEPFRRRGAQIHFVELEASLETRIVRNRTELRLSQKASKRDLGASEQRLRRIHEQSKDRSFPFPYPDAYWKLCNETLSPSTAARAICDHFQISTRSDASAKTVPLSASDLTVNPFIHKSAAERYARGRPFFHGIVRDALKEQFPLRAWRGTAVDVACGTGLSTKILVELADRVIGTDASAEMIALAPRLDRVTYLVAPAESLPVESNSADLVTVALAFHWLDRDRFLREALRILKSNGLLVIYNHWFRGKMSANAKFETEFQRDYLERYPNPRRDSRPFGSAEAKVAGFKPEGRREFSHEIGFSHEELSLYLVTQSNVIAAVEGGRETLASAFHWIEQASAPFFTGERRDFQFAGVIDYFSPMPTADPAKDA